MLDNVVDLLLDFAVMGGIPGYFALQLWSAIAWRGAWRLAALLPLLPALPIAAWCLWALGQDSNLWPLPFIFFAPLGALYLLLAAVARAALPGPA